MRSNADHNQAKKCCSSAATLQKTASNFFHLCDLPYPAWLKFFPWDFTHMFLKTNSSRLNLSTSKNNTKLLSFTTGSFAKLILYILFIFELLNCFALLLFPSTHTCLTCFKYSANWRASGDFHQFLKLSVKFFSCPASLLLLSIMQSNLLLMCLGISVCLLFTYISISLFNFLTIHPTV